MAITVTKFASKNADIGFQLARLKPPILNRNATRRDRLKLNRAEAREVYLRSWLESKRRQRV